MAEALILASASPRRRELLALLGLPFTVASADVNEGAMEGEPPGVMVMRLSLAKARQVARDRSCGWIIAADTVVVSDGRILGKPANQSEATAMLQRMRGQPHVVYSGVVLWNAATGRYASDLAETQVWMRDYSDEEITRYVASSDPLDKAGAYGIQNCDFHPVSRVEGCYASVMGFPLCHLYRLLRRWGRSLPATPAAACRAFTGHDCQVYGAVVR